MIKEVRFYANLSPVVGSEQGGIRPVLIIQNNKGNLFSPTLIVAPITRNVSKRLQPTQVLIEIPITSAGRHHLFC